MDDVSALWSRRPSLVGRLVTMLLGVTVRPAGRLGRDTRCGIALVRVVLALLCYLPPRRPARRWRVREAYDAGVVHGEWVGATPTPGQRVLYYLHGSAYVGCSPATHRGLVSELARRLGTPAFALRYRRAPESTFPAAHDDAVRGYLWLLQRGHRPEDIVLAGDSAGGHLALGLCRALRARGVQQPRAVVCFSPVIDATWSLAAAQEDAVRDAFTTAATGRRLMGWYLVDADPQDARLDLVRSVRDDDPPVLIQVGAQEVLRADAEAYAAATRSAGATCEVEVWPAMFHVFQLSHSLVPEARAALDRVERFLSADAPALRGLRPG